MTDETTTEVPPAQGDLAAAEPAQDGAAQKGGEESVQVTVTDLGPCKRSLAITVTANRIEGEFDRAYRELGNTVHVPGFRLGKAPRRLLEKRFGDELHDDVRNRVLDEVLEEALERHEIKPLGRPKLEDEDLKLEHGKDLSFTVIVEEEPRFDLPEYKGVEVQVPSAEVSAEDLDKAIESFRRSRGEVVSVSDGTVTEGDALVVDFTAEAGDTSFAEEKGVFTILGEGKLSRFAIEGLQERFLGKKVGDEVALDAVVPKDHPRTDLRGHQAELRVTVQEIKRVDYPELTDAWIQTLGFEGVDDFRKHLQESLQRRKQAEVDERIEQAVLDKLLEGVTIDLPEDFVARETERYIQRTVMRALYAGVPEAEVDAEARRLRSEGPEDVIKGLRAYFLLEKIAEKEGIFATESAVEERIDVIARNQGKLRYEIREQYEQRGTMPQLRAEIRADLTRAMLRENAKITAAGAEA